LVKKRSITKKKRREKSSSLEKKKIQRCSSGGVRITKKKGELHITQGPQVEKVRNQVGGKSRHWEKCTAQKPHQKGKGVLGKK